MRGIVMLERIVNKLRQYKWFSVLLWSAIAILQKCALFLNPFLSVLRFWKIRRIDKRITGWCFKSEKDIEGMIKGGTSHYMKASFEIHFQNSGYGYAKVLKDYSGLPETYPIKVCYSHGAHFDSSKFAPNMPTAPAYNFDIPVFFAWGRFEEKIMQIYRPQNKVFVIGTPFLYADSLFSKEYIQQERNRLGKNLLVFPAHSTLTTKYIFDGSKFIDGILSKYKTRFDTIRVCMHWNDIVRNRHRPYIDKGIECVTAGNNEDINFIRRLKGLFQICDASLSNVIGSHIGYSISLNKAVTLMLSKINLDLSGSPYELSQLILNNCPAPELQKLEELLSINDELTITDEIRETIEPFWGLREKKTKEELRQIFYEAEQLFQKSPKRHFFLAWR
jgi:hypothetical protein